MTFTETPSSIEDKPRQESDGGIGRDPAWEGGLKGVKIARKLAVGSGAKRRPEQSEGSQSAVGNKTSNPAYILL
jgi:hypothetical protein